MQEVPKCPKCQNDNVCVCARARARVYKCTCARAHTLIHTYNIEMQDVTSVSTQETVIHALLLAKEFQSI
jgi:uncharacterized protein (UPF0179 family)